MKDITDVIQKKVEVSGKYDIAPHLEREARCQGPLPQEGLRSTLEHVAKKGRRG